MRRLQSVWAATAMCALLVSGAGWAAHHGGGGEKGHHGKHHKKMFGKRDADGNGAISKAEWLAGAEERFGKMDADANGAVSEEEWRAGREAMRKRCKEKHGKGHERE